MRLEARRGAGERGVRPCSNAGPTMADRVRRRKYYTRTSSNSSGSPRPLIKEDGGVMGKPRPDVSPGSGKETPEKRKVRPKRERWLLTRKTWRYMADAGRKLIPDGLQNRPEDVPKIEAYFQEVCYKEPRFLLWRKQSYPGALGFRSRGRSRGGRKKIGGSCRDRTSSADEAEDIKKLSGANTTSQPVCRLDLKRLKEEFLLGFPNPSQAQPQTTVSSPEEESEAFLETLEMYLNEKPADPKVPGTSKSSFNHEELLSKLRDYLDSIERVTVEERARPQKPPSVHFEGDHMQKMLLETIRRHFGKSTNREKVISDLLTDRKSLERLYFDLRKARGFQSGRRSGDSVGGSPYGGSYNASRLRPLWRSSGSGSSFRYQDLREEEGSDDEVDDSRIISSAPVSPPPVIEVVCDDPQEKCFATQTEMIPESTFLAIKEELKRLQLVKQEAEEQATKEEQRTTKTIQRRTSVTDNDDVSPSVGDTIKRYLRMARKKSLDSDKTDRFKRVNYDKNIRNIRPKGEITQIGDDDGLDKGIQTEESWVVALKELKLEYKPEEVSPPAEDQSSSRITSSRSSVDTGVEDMFSPPQTPVPTTKSSSGILSSGQTFLSNLLHHQKSRNASSSVSTVPGVMQKSKSSSSVVHQGSRLVTKKIWKSRSKSQTRATPSATSAWTPQVTAKLTLLVCGAVTSRCNCQPIFCVESVSKPSVLMNNYTNRTLIKTQNVVH